MATEWAVGHSERDLAAQCGDYGYAERQNDGGRGERGYDGAKKSKGRKRHLLVETQGLGLACTVHAADVMDRDGVTLLLSPEETPAQFPPLAHVWLDAGYNGPGKGKDWIEKE